MFLFRYLNFMKIGMCVCYVCYCLVVVLWVSGEDVLFFL